MPISGLDAPVQPYNVTPPDVMGNMARMASLKQMLGQNQMIPGALQTQTLDNQQRQQTLAQGQQMDPLQVQQQQIATEKARTEFESQKTMMNAISSGSLNKFAGASAPDGSGFDAAGAYADLVKSGVLPEQAGPVISSFQGIAAKNAEIRKNLGEAGASFLKNRQESHQQMAKDIASVMDLPANQQDFALQTMKANYAKTPLPGIDPNDLAMFQQADTAHLRPLASVLNLDASIDSFHAEQAQKAADSKKAALGVAAPSQDQINTFTKTTIPSFQALMPEQKNAAIAEANQARTVPELDTVIARADASDKAMQMHKDSLAQTKALVGNKFGEAGLAANDKIWTDPAHGFAGALAQAKQTKQSIVAGADGNGLLTSMVPTMEVLGINHAAGISRISPQEAQAAGMPGGWAERWNAWATKSATGKLTPRLAEEGSQLMDVVLGSAHQKALMSSALIAKGHGLTPEQTPAMDEEGNVTTLDKAMGNGARTGTGAISVGQTVTIKGKTMKVTAVHPDMSFDAK